MNDKVMKKIIETLPDGFLVIDEKDEVIFSNKLGEQLRDAEMNDEDIIEHNSKFYTLQHKKIPSGKLSIWRDITEIRKLKELMIIDPETGALCSRYMHEELEREIDRVHRAGSQMGLALIDVDPGENGPSLKEITEELQKAIRIYDKIFRGDRSDFVIMFFVVESNKIEITGQRFLKILKELGIAKVSIGITLSEKAPSAEAMMRQAQRALYVVDARGGNDYSIY